MLHSVSSDINQEINKYKEYVSLLNDPLAQDENKLKVAQEVSEHFEDIAHSPQYQVFLNHCVPRFVKLLQDGEPSFVLENHGQQLRKLVLDILHRIPTNDYLKPHVKMILNLCFQLLEVDNEENVQVCLKILIELHKQFRPQMAPEIQHFLALVKRIYSELPRNMSWLFENPTISDGSMPDPTRIGTITPIQYRERGNMSAAGVTTVNRTYVPKALNSMKVLQEIPITVVLMYQLYKAATQSVVAEFIPLIMSTLLLQPSQQARASPNFNKELFVDFTAAQVKTLSFIAFFVRPYHESIIQYSNEMVTAMLQLLTNCPPEVASLRKELLIAVRHILATDLRTKFVPRMDSLLDEEILVSSGWSACETLRPLAYSTLADLAHHVRAQLSLSQLASAVHLFSKNVHDDSLPCSIQTMSCKLLLNLVEGITKKSEVEKSSQGREILMRMLEVFVLKFHTITKYQLPAILAKCKPQSEATGQTDNSSNSNATGSNNSNSGNTGSNSSSIQSTSASTPTSAPTTPGPSTQQQHGSLPSSKSTDTDNSKQDDGKGSSTISVSDCRSLVKTLVCGVKTITWGAGSCKSQFNEQQSSTNQQFLPQETVLFTKLVRYALQALDIYQINVGANGQAYVRASNCPTVRMKEEKEVLEHFAGVFTILSPSTFKEIFSTTITYMVDRIYKNYALQIVANSFLASPHTSPTFATILVEYLLERLKDMGEPGEKSNLYLKLFKLVFGSVSLFANENEQMLKPHLHTIVTRSMELANTAHDPFNYFLLLRALFRSIGGGSHDSLYQEFLPLLPNLLQGLNSLQSGLHKQHMKDLFVELCLTVPVRLSSLLPYLPMLMDPLVSALNGSQTLITQGLRTLELCVDNLQPDFLYDHIQPVRAELMQALWRTLRNPSDGIAHVAFRVLGKFGGSNRKMLKEAQRLEYNDSDSLGPCIRVDFLDCKTPVYLPVQQIVESALKCLKSLGTDTYYRRQSFEVIKCYLICMMNNDVGQIDFSHLIQHSTFTTGKFPHVPVSSLPKCQDTVTRNTFKQSLTAAIMCAVIKDLQVVALPFVAHVVRHYTLVALSQQAGPFPLTAKQQSQQGSMGFCAGVNSWWSGMDPLVLIDSIAECMAYEEKELCKVGTIAISIIIEVTSTVLGSRERASKLPLFSYLVDRMCACCYDRAWYAKYGGCIAIRYLMEQMPLKWVLEQQFVFLRALLFVMMDLTSEVSSGAIDRAKDILQNLLKKCASPLTSPLSEDREAVALQTTSFNQVMRELVREVTSPNQLVREQAMSSLHTLAETSEKSVTSIMAPHRDVLADMIPPRKHLLRHQPVNTQIGLMDGNTFCNTLNPRLFTIDLAIVEHKVFFTELFNICEADDAALKKLACYKNVASLVPLRISAMKVLAALHYIPQVKDRIINVLFKQLGSESEELMKTAEECIEKFLKGTAEEGKPVENEVLHNAMRPTLFKMGDYRSLTLSVVRHLATLSRLFPNSFNEKLCEQLYTHLGKWLEVVLHKHQSHTDIQQELKLCVAILDIFHLIPLAPQSLLEPLITSVVKTEAGLMTEIGSPLREPLFQFVVQHPDEALLIFLQEVHVTNAHWNRLMTFFLKKQDENGRLLRHTMEQKSSQLLDVCFSRQLYYHGLQVIWILAKNNSNYLVQHVNIIKKLQLIWSSREFQQRHKHDQSLTIHFNEPRILAKILNLYVSNNPDNVELHFQLLRGFSGRSLADFTFLKTWFEEKIPTTYSILQKRKVFFKYVELFHDDAFPAELKAYALQYILIPMFKKTFENGEGEQIIGGPPNPESDNHNDCISVFINQVIDPDQPYGVPDAVRIQLLRFLALLVENASTHIHDPGNKRHGNKLRRIMTFAWPCLLPKNCIDPATKYHGHLLLSHIIAKFAIHKRIVLQTFYSLLKAHAVEARAVVRQALDILTPAMPTRMEDGNQMLTHWTRKIIVEEGHTIAQLMHVLQLIVRHCMVYYPVNNGLIQQMVASMQRLGLAPNINAEHRRLAVDVAEVLLKWELRRLQESGILDSGDDAVKHLTYPMSNISLMKTLSGELQTSSSHQVSPIDKKHSDSVVNFLLRMTCQGNDSSGGSTGEILGRRCIALLKKALKPEVWLNSDLHLGWLEKLLLSVEAYQQNNMSNICTALDLLTLLLQHLPKESILTTFKPIQNGIAACMNCSSTKIIRSVQMLLSRLMSIFPTERSILSVSSMHEQLEVLYTAVGKNIQEGLATYEKTTNATASSLFPTLLILKSACTHNVSYIDRLMSVFMKTFLKLVKDHLNPAQAPGQTTPEPNPASGELIIICLELVKNRVSVMSSDVRKTFIQNILAQLIEKSVDGKILKAITKTMDEWLKIKSTPEASQVPTMREKSHLLLKMMTFIEKRFPDDLELQASFLELVNYVYRDESLIRSDLTSKLEPAFLAGLRCKQPAIRQKFVEVFDRSIKQKLYDRLLYIICSQNWEAMGSHFWIKQCIELLFAVCDKGTSIFSRGSPYLLPSITNVVNLADSQERQVFEMMSRVKTEPMEVDMDNKDDDESQMMETNSISGNTRLKSPIQHSKSKDPKQLLATLITKHGRFLESVTEVKICSFLNSVTQLCHHDTDLASKVWIQLFPRIWKVLSDKQQDILRGEIGSFICSGAHLVQKDCQPSSLHTFVESLSHCIPQLKLRPCVVKYLGKTHNLWLRCAIMLENLSTERGLYLSKPKQQSRGSSSYVPENINSEQQEILDSLCNLYSLLREEDMWAGLWQKRCKFPDTAKAIAFEQQGFFEQAQSTYESLMSQARDDHNKGPAPITNIPEYQVWEEHWIRCCKELNQWEILTEYGNKGSVCNSHLVLDCAWRLPDWTTMKDALVQVELSCPKEMAWKVNMYRGFLAICHPDEHHLHLIERLVDMASSQAIKEWKRLPRIVSHIHTPLLQAAQQIIELQEASQVHQSLQPSNLGRSNSLHDMKAIVKTWRNRLPMTSDDLSHWSDIFIWRHHHYQAIVQAYDDMSALQPDPNSNHAMLGVHASASAIIHYGKIARKHGQINSALDSLSRIHSIPSVPIVDCFQKIRQQVKCYLQMTGVMGKGECMHGLEVIESTNLKYFTKEMTAEFYALKGMFLAEIGKSEEANKAFSAAVQMHDVLVKAWALWGDYLENVFVQQPSQIKQGVSAITCYLHACRHQNEHKSRKYLAKVIWLLSYDDSECALADAVDKYSVGVPPIQWLAWVPQLLTCLVCSHGAKILNLLSHVARVFPQAVYFPIRTLYLTLKIEQRERYKSSEVNTAGTAVSSGNESSQESSSGENKPNVVVSQQSQTQTQQQNTTAGGSDSGPIRATPSMWRCSRIMHMQRDLHPTLLSSLEGIVDQMVWFRENWHEEVLRQLCQGLAKCYSVAFENRAAVSQARITPHTLNFVRKLVSTFGVGIENVSNVTQTFSSAASESLARRVQATAQDPVFQKMKTQFTTDFDFSIPGSMKLHNVIQKLKKWIKILEARTKVMQKSFLIEEKCRFLSNFSASTAEVEIPGEFLMPKATHYYVKIARFMPRVEIVQKHNTAARRLYIRGHNGKIYPYLVMNDGCLIESRREERVLQLLRLLNPGLEKRKETAKRQLLFTVPRVVAVSPQMRLVEDNPSSLSLLHIYKQRCAKKNVEYDAPISRYYERLTSVQARGTQVGHQVLRDIQKEVQSNTVPRSMLKEWATHTFPAATDYWTFRKTVTLQLALLGFAEFVLHLSRLNPEMLQIAQDSGHLHAAYFRFDVGDNTGELDANRSVPFRLTPNITSFISPVGVSSVLTAAMIATARCFMQPSFKVEGLLRAILRDEMIAWYKKKQDDVTQPATMVPPNTQPPDIASDQLVALVNHAVKMIMSRLQNLAEFEGGESKVTSLVNAATLQENLCRMDPAWHPWL
uniref:transformation/transcription domain-associated protein-like n=1 Tax=Styela clava TaxID=7725 RepID=UPI001939B93A|nr:transformation/transcription domain-associated protein-like [Styela clava]